MTDKKLIKQEIERLYAEVSQKPYNGEVEGEMCAYDKLISFIDSLQEEHNEDLEEAADAFYDNCNMPKSSWWDEGVLHKMSESKETFIAGAEWQKQQMMKDAVDATIFSELKSSDGSLFQAKSDRFRMNGVKISDRIKVIPIKTEQQ